MKSTHNWVKMFITNKQKEKEKIIALKRKKIFFGKTFTKELKRANAFF